VRVRPPLPRSAGIRGGIGTFSPVQQALPQSRAAGFVLTREGDAGEPQYLLLVNKRDGMPGLPKGHAEPGEDDLRTALRETEEETGLTDLDVDPWFVREIAYRVRKHGEPRWKTVVYLRAGLRSGEVRLSHEHTAFSWLPLEEALRRITFDSLRNVLTAAALHRKDPALFRIQPPDLEEADRRLASLPHADEKLLGHLRGGSRLARAFAEGMAAAGSKVNVPATEVGALLHDVGRALGRHEDHRSRASSTSTRRRSRPTRSRASPTSRKARPSRSSSPPASPRPARRRSSARSTRRA
jgi:bis(5'-nucleosidyl)-tetraphosphatase